MSSLYRCKIRVGYRPAFSDKLIVFEERQIQEAIIKLKWQPGIIDYGLTGNAPGQNFLNTLDQSKASVTISDPYLTGPTWPVLFDLASLYNVKGASTANNIMLPPCKPGESDKNGKCFNYSSISSEELSSDVSAQQATDLYAFLFISMWYDVKGVTFGTDYYFRVDGVSISHGASYPSVTIRGVDPRSVVFNQDIGNFGFDEGISLEEAIKQVAEDYNYRVDFCVPPDSDVSQTRRLPRNVRLKGVTADEVIKRMVKSTGGSINSQPTREYKNRLSICTRGELNLGCSVFYLGKGLYESYEINGQVEDNNFNLNYSNGAAQANAADQWLSEGFEAKEYVLSDAFKEPALRALRNVKKISFPSLFQSTEPRPAGVLNTGRVWRGAGPVVKEETLEKTNLYGLSPNGTTAISFLSGNVLEADQRTGRVLIETDFSLSICQKGAEEKCFWRKIRQESVNLSTVGARIGAKVGISEKIGTSTAQRKEFVRFYIVGHNNTIVTLDPQLVWKFAVPNIDLQRVIASDPSNTSSTTPPPAPVLPPDPNAPASEVVIGRVGSTGRSSGPHIHAQICKDVNCGGGAAGSEQQLEALLNRHVKVSGKPLNGTNFPITSRYGAGRNHQGIDYGIAQGEVITIGNGATVADTYFESGFGNSVVFRTPDGFIVILAHLQDNSIPPNISGLSTRSDGGKTDSGFKPGPVPTGLTVETSFKAVPRALRIIPGKTVLSFITNYDEWLEQGRSITSADPGVWIAKRFANWFISEVEYKWRDGDARVDITGVSAWGSRPITVPTFTKYIEDSRKAGQLTDITSTYYDYIRSLGSLDWILDDGSFSSVVNCPEAEDLSRVLSRAPEGANPTTSGVASSAGFPTAGCQYTGSKYPKDRVNAILNAAYSAGINTREGLAGVIGNAIAESGAGLSPTAVGDSGNALGIFQWNSRRPNLIKFAAETGGSPTDFGTQLRFFKAELTPRSGYTERLVIPSLNSATSPEQAASDFDRIFTRSAGLAEQKRRALAREIFNGLKCSRPK